MNTLKSVYVFFLNKYSDNSAIKLLANNWSINFVSSGTALSTLQFKQLDTGQSDLSPDPGNYR